MTLVRPVADIASVPAPGWTAAPLFEKVDSVEPDDTTFITGLAPGAQDPQVALQLGDLGIPYGASGQLIVRARLRWDGALTQPPAAVRMGLADAAALAGSDPSLLFERSLAAFSSVAFETVEVVFPYADWAGDSDAFGIYIEMTPDGADAARSGQISWIEVEACRPATIIGDCTLGSTTARAVITEARDHHPMFEPRRHPNATLLRLLSSYQREVTAKIARVNPALVATPLTVTLPLTDFDEGVTLPSYVYALPGVEARYAQNTDQVEVIELVNLTNRAQQNYGHNVVYLRGNKLFLSGRADNWLQFGSLTVNLVLTPRELTGLDDVLRLPDWGSDAYVATLVQKMAIREGINGPLLSAAATMEQEFLDSVAQQKAAQASYTRDVFPGGF